jgi:hypothetical protein
VFPLTNIFEKNSIRSVLFIEPSKTSKVMYPSYVNTGSMENLMSDRNDAVRSLLSFKLFD